MESFLPRGGFQLPFQKRLSRLYNDTKKSSDFVKEPVQNEEDPEIKALHRKLRIQKDRLVSWGLEWSDPTQSAEIDESLSKAGLSEVVGSIMSTIKDILAEAEPLWLSSKRLVHAAPTSQDTKPPLIQWDKNRFEDLVNDLTTSIDTLFDLSRTRSSGTMLHRSSKSPLKSPSTSEDFRPFESTRMQTPQQIDPKTLTHLHPRQGDDASSPREVVLMSKTAYSELTHGTSRQPWAPLLLEYATFDSIFAMTGIMPPMARFEKLSAGLQQDPKRSPGTWTGLPRLLGYFEDIENSRLGLVYRFPPSFNAVSFTKNPVYNLPTLGDLLLRPDSEPRLEAKFRLAHNLVNTVFDMHARGVTHGNLIDKTISFCDAVTTEPGVLNGEVDIRRPLISSFDLFPDDTPAATPILSRHPLDPRNMATSPLANNADQRVLDLYSLAMILLSIGLWTKLEDLVLDSSSTFVSESLLEQLAVRCGTLYMKAVQACWSAVDDELAGRSSGETLLSSVQVRASRFLEACCILDGVSGLEERLEQETNQDQPILPSIASAPIPTSKGGKESKERKESKDLKTLKPNSKPLSEKQALKEADKSAREKDVEKAGTNGDPEEIVSEKPSGKEAKVRLYPQVPIAPEIVDRWNKILMPQINHALRHFYRKHPESVEISLESIGSCPQKIQPTVLVVCTSVGKVRAILNKRLGDLFDETTGFALKVCRGHVLRSRRQPNSVLRSMARRSNAEGGEDSLGAINPEYQERPGNGASIGAWIGDRHLPPVSLGGLVVIDNKAYGMTVHHMLDDPDRDFGNDDALRCSALPDLDWYAGSGEDSNDDGDFAYELSDTESEAYSDSDITSDYEDDEDDEDEEFNEPGDIPGVEPGCGDGYIVTQPALDDVEEGFYPCPETEDEDHIDTYSLGEIYASSGIRRKHANGLVHEVDWALFEFADDRMPDDNSIPRAQASESLRKLGPTHKAALLRPTTVAPSASLPGLEVQCMARTSGLQTGQILPALTSVKIYGRASPSHTYQVTSSTPPQDSRKRPGVPLGIPGDSGAWVIDRRHGQLCGHVLAWSQRKHVAYICPMDVLLLDIAETLEAHEVKLPGGEPVITQEYQEGRQSSNEKPAPHPDEDLDDLVEEEPEDDDLPPPRLVTTFNTQDSTSHMKRGDSSCNVSELGSSSPIRLDTSSELGGLTSRFDEISMSGNLGIGVSG